MGRYSRAMTSELQSEVFDTVKSPMLCLGMVRIALHSLSLPLNCPQSAVDKPGLS